ncbi:hypothetical protein T492DRAFT_878800 [Pavlovales sp. CCMP2436]|nr:hypothetical protein T492DRAFT_878800 [Pavlovales sp. CCMP2436]
MADHSAAKPAYSATACAARLGRLRETLDATGASGLLLIAGVDSRRHELSQRTLKWLLLGASGPGDEGACAADEAIDEVVLLVTRTGAKLYCTLASWRTLMPIVAHWRGLELHCLCETGAYEDADVVEAHKIRSFVGMLSSLAAEAGSGDLKKGGLLPVAMPVETAGEVERWPVVQAYALDDETVTLGSSADNKPAATGRGFFSMRHRVVPTFDFLSSSVLR